MYICDSVVNVCQLLPERYPVEDATFNFLLNYEIEYRLFEPLHCAWLRVLMMFFPSILQILEVWTNLLLAACEQGVTFLVSFSYRWIVQRLVKILLFIYHKIVGSACLLLLLCCQIFLFVWFLFTWGFVWFLFVFFFLFDWWVGLLVVFFFL